MYFWLKFCTQWFLIRYFVYLQKEADGKTRRQQAAYFNVVSQMLLSLYLGSISLGSICLNLIQADLRRGMKLIYVLFQVSPFMTSWNPCRAAPIFVNTEL